VEFALVLEQHRLTSLRDPERVAAVQRTGLLEQPPDPALDRLARLTAGALRAPAAMICLVADEHQYLAGQSGLPEPLASARGGPLTQSLCQYAVAGRAPLVVADARLHPELTDHPAVAELGIAAFAGVPLFDADGWALGALCVIDHAPRAWTDDELAMLQDLAVLATGRLRRDPPDRPGDHAPAARPDYDALPVMLWRVGPDGACEYVNARWLEFTGRALGSDPSAGWLDRIHPDDRTAWEARLQQAVARREPLQAEYRLRRADEQYRWVLDVAVPRFDPAGRFLGLTGSSTDVTDRRQLEQRVAQTERTQAIAQLAGGIAHDFNNLLTGILGHVTLLEEETGLSPLGREDLGQIQQSAERAASLTRQLLAFTRRQAMAPRLLDLNQLVTGALSRLRRLAGEPVRVVWTPAPTVDPIVADANQLEQVLIHLATMARDSMPQGGTLELATRQERLEGGRARPSSPRGGSYVVLEVRDTGRGMDATTIDQAMEPLLASGPGSEGAGYGLAAVYGIVRQAGGTVEVNSEPDRGTTFTLSFPRHEGSGPVGGAIGGPEPSGGSETILLVEDEEQVRELARRVLERVGYTVLAAANSAAATAIADRHAGHIHLLVTDMQLPQLGGRELAARLSIHRPAIKVLYISGTADGSVARLRLLEPGTHFLEKPFSLDRLLRTIRSALGDPVASSRPA
jgi:PAS domain S-box-containing protein